MTRSCHSATLPRNVKLATGTAFRMSDSHASRAIAWAALRSTALIAIAGLLVFVVFPAVLGAAGTQVASGP